MPLKRDLLRYYLGDHIVGSFSLAFDNPVVNHFGVRVFVFSDLGRGWFCRRR